MQAGITAFLESLKANKLGAILTFIFIMFFAIGQNPEILSGLPDSFKGPVISIAAVIRATIVGYGIFYSVKTWSADELKGKLEEVQAKPNQTVLPTKELVEAAQLIKSPDGPPAIVITKNPE